MYNFINIEWTWLGAYILAHFLQKYSDVGFSWEWFQKNDIFPIFINPEIYWQIYSLVPEIENISDIYPMYYNWVSSTCRRIWTQSLAWFTRWYSEQKNTLIASTTSQDNWVFISQIPTLKFFSFQWSYSYGYYEYFHTTWYPYYIFVWDDISYVAFYRKEDIVDFLFKKNIVIQDIPDFELKTGISYTKNFIAGENKIFYASWYGIVPFFLWLWNFIAFIDSILVFLYISKHHETYIKLLYSYRKKIAFDIHKSLQKNPYILIEADVEKFLENFLNSLMKDLYTIV